MWRSFFLYLALPSLGLAAPWSLSFDQGFTVGQSSTLRAPGMELALAGPSDASGKGRSLALTLSPTGAATDNAQALLRLALSPDLADQELDRLAPNRLLSLSLRVNGQGHGCEICLESRQGQKACLDHWPLSNAWQALGIALPGADGPLALQGAGPGFKAAYLTLRPLSRSGASGAWACQIDDLGLGLPASPGANTLAQAFGVSVQAAASARALGLPDLLTWVLLVLQERCACSVESLAVERMTKSWGEIAQDHGLSWDDAIAAALQKGADAGLKPQAPTREQKDRANQNEALVGGRP